MRPRHPLFALIAALLAVGTVMASARTTDPAAAPPPFIPSAETQQAFLEQLAGVRDARERAERVARLALVERPGGELQELAERTLDAEIGDAKPALRAIFLEGDEAARLGVLDLYRRYYRTVLGVGFEPWTVEMVRRGLEDRSPRVRRTTMAFAAENHLPRIAHFLIDAAEVEPDLTVGALLGIEQSGDPLGARWTTAKIADPDPAVHAAALRATARMERRGAFFARTMAEEKEPRLRRAGIEGLLTLAARDDIPFLTAWLEKPEAGPPELRERVVRALSELEVGTYSPSLPPRPAFSP